MKKLTTLFVVLTLATTGCNKKKDDGDVVPKKADDKVAKPDDKKPDDKGSAAAPAAPATPAAPTADIPQECQDYKTAMEKLASCDKMPAATKDAMKQGYDALSAGWAQAAGLPAEAKKAMADGCKQGTDALMQSGKALCGW